MTWLLTPTKIAAVSFLSESTGEVCCVAAAYAQAIHILKGFEAVGKEPGGKNQGEMVSYGMALLAALNQLRAVAMETANNPLKTNKTALLTVNILNNNEYDLLQKTFINHMRLV